MNVLIIDPWFMEYTQGLCENLQKEIKVDIVSSVKNYVQFKDQFTLYPMFNRYSDKYKKYKFNKILKGVEYILTYFKILKLIKKNKYDIVHIQWFLLYPVDAFFLKKFSKLTKNVIYTAHNAIPHINKPKIYYTALAQIYNNVDKILVHGCAIKEEISKKFNISEKKIIIQNFGFNVINKNSENFVSDIEQQVIKKIQHIKGKKIVYIGNIFENKGVDRLMKFWIENGSNYLDDSMIICGEINEESFKLNILSKKFKITKNAVYYPERFSEGFHNEILQAADIILLPYRHASMSGVVFTAAQFSKTVLSTDVGAIGEYLKGCPNLFLVENSSVAFDAELKKILAVSKDTLALYGKKYHEYMSSKFSWEIVAKEVIDIYRQVKNYEN